MFTASHNPAKYNGIKLCLAGAKPVGQESGLVQIRQEAERFLAEGIPASDTIGTITQQDVLVAYAAYMKQLVPDLVGIRPLKVVVDAANGMGGHTVPTTFEGLPLDVTEMYFELDGSFPHHEANPIDPANLRDLQARVIAEGADIGLAFDGDADRCFVVDERGEIVSPSTLTALIAARELLREPGSTIIHNLITSRSVPDVVTELGGTPVRTRVGHSYIKAEMASTPATSTSATSGTPTRACSLPCTRSRRSGTRTARCRGCWPRTSGSCRRARSTRRWRTRPRRWRRSRRPTPASRRTSSTA
jgi:phosphomannomutase